MSVIKLSYESDVLLSDSDLSILIDDNDITYKINKKEILFDWSEEFGIHFLKILNKSQGLFKLLDIQIDNDSIRHLLYLANLEKDKRKRDSTWVKKENGALTIPFGHPLSWWYSKCSTLIDNGCIGDNLYSKFEVYYPKSVSIPTHTYSKFLQGFFKYDFDFTVVPIKDFETPLHSKTVPYVKANLQYDQNKLFNEFDSKQDTLFNGNYSPSQSKYNAHWKLSMCVPMSEENKSSLTGWKSSYIYQPEEFPYLYQLLEQISAFGDVYIYHVFVGSVAPGTTVDPHKDDLSKIYAGKGYDVAGLCQIFIPVVWKPGNYYKFGSVGLIDYDQGAIVSNNHEYVHASINESDAVRYTIGIYCKFTGNNILNDRNSRD